MTRRGSKAKIKCGVWTPPNRQNGNVNRTCGFTGTRAEVQAHQLVAHPHCQYCSVVQTPETLVVHEKLCKRRVKIACPICDMPIQKRGLEKHQSTTLCQVVALRHDLAVSGAVRISDSAVQVLKRAGVEAHIEEHRTHYTAAGFGNCSRVENETYTTNPQVAEIVRAIQDLAVVTCSSPLEQLRWEDIDVLLVDVVRLHLAPRTDVGLAVLALLEAHAADKAWPLIVEAMPEEWHWRLRQAQWRASHRGHEQHSSNPNQLTLALGDRA